MNLEKISTKMILQAIESVKPINVIKNSVKIDGHTLHIKDIKINLNKYSEIHIVGAGKASAQMASSLENCLKEKLTGGYIITKYEHSVKTEKVIIKEASHPILDENTLKYSQDLKNYIQNTPQDSLILTVISGGGSALLEILPQELSLAHLQNTVSLLLNCGAQIQEINTVRKHLSLIKGGRLLESIYPRENLSLIISDIIGDPVEFIASGPTAPDNTTFADAQTILEKYELTTKVNPEVLSYLKKGISGKIPETPKTQNKIFKKSKNLFLAHNISVLKLLEQLCRENGFNPIVLGGMIEGEAKEVGGIIASMAKSINYQNYPHKKPAAIIWGGETTVTIKGKGKGGRNQELALSFLDKIKNDKFKFCYIACGTDGTDGPTDAAGAVVCKRTLNRMKKLNLKPLEYLQNNNSYEFWKQVGGLLITGPTQTNVMDINLLLVP